MAKVSDNEFPKVILAEGAAPATPDSGLVKLYAKTDGQLYSKDDAGAETALGGGGLADQGAFTYLDATEAAAPGTPATGKVRVYAKTDGRIYSKDDGGVEYGPFDAAGGGDLSALRLSSVSDDPGDIALGTYGTEFEYADQTALEAVWSAVGSGTIIRAAGSAAIWYCTNAAGKGMLRSTSGFASNFEVALLVSNCATPYQGIALCDASGNNGLGTMFDGSGGSAYMSRMTGYVYAGSDATGSNYADWLDGRPVWWAIRKDGTDWRWRRSTDGSTWTTILTKSDSGVTVERIGWMQFYGTASQNAMVHRMVYGTPDLGL